MKCLGLPHPQPLPSKGRGVPAGVLSLLGCFPVGTRASRPRMSDCCYSAGGTPAYHCPRLMAGCYLVGGTPAYHCPRLMAGCYLAGGTPAYLRPRLFVDLLFGACSAYNDNGSSNCYILFPRKIATEFCIAMWVNRRCSMPRFPILHVVSADSTWSIYQSSTLLSPSLYVEICLKLCRYCPYRTGY